MPASNDARRIDSVDLIFAALVALTAFGVYLRTLFPGLGGGGDSAKFQYVGSVLGTPHPPGYPLYVLVSYCFAHLPFGSLAWRINVMSAFFSAATVLLTVLILVRLGARRSVAVATALAVAFDVGVWAYALRAEVYSLASALVALLLFFAIRWQSTGRERDLYLMVGIFALSLGNHLTVTTLIPGLLAFVLVTNRRAIQSRTVVVSALIVAAGVAQYGFILLRTLQNAPYLEARATNLRELLDVMRASRFAYQVFAFSPYQLLAERVPRLWQVCVAEFNPLGTVLVLLGLAALFVRRMTAGVLIVLGAGGILFLTLNVDADVEGFLVPAFVLIWVVAGIGLEALCRAASGRFKHAAAAGIAVALVLPSWQVVRNYRANDHHRRNYEIRYFDALFEQLESRAAIVSEAYAVDQLVLYKLIGERAARGRTIEIVPTDQAVVRQRATSGFAVYAFSEGHDALERNGFRFEAVRLPPPRASAGPPIDMTPLPLFRLVKSTPCSDIGNTGWKEVTEVVRDGQVLVRIDNYRPFESRLVMYVGGRSASPSSPLLAISQGPQSPDLTVATFDASRRPELVAALQRDGLSQAGVLTEEATVQRLELKVNDGGQFSWSALDLRARPDVAFVRASVDLDNPRRASVCGWSGRNLFETGDEGRVPIGAGGETWFGAGWHAVERSNAGVEFRWTSSREAEVLVPLARTGTISVRLRVDPFAYPGAPHSQVRLTVNSVDLGSRAVSTGWGLYEWKVPADVWHVGFNRLTVGSSRVASPAALGLSGDTRSLGVAVSELDLRMTPGDNPAAQSRERR